MIRTSAKTRRHQELRRLYEAASRDNRVARFYEDFNEVLVGDGADIQNRWSIRELFEQFVEDGREAANALRPVSDGGFHIQESAELVDTSMFANIMGQVLYNTTLQGYNTPDLIGSMLMETVQTQFSGERIPGIGRIGDDVEAISEGQPYPNATFSEEYVDTPETIKRGLILNITREVIFFDRTGILLQEASNMGQRIAVNKEKRILDVVCGITTIYRRNGAAAEATYQADNQASNTLADWTSIDTAQQKFNVQTDPTTGELIAAQIDVVVVPKALEQTAKRIKAATMVRTTSNTNQNTYTPGNQIDNGFQVVSGQYVRQRTSSDTTWFAGQPKKAFVYMQNWPLQVSQSNENSEVGFTRDIVARYKASERGGPAVRDRRYMLKNTPPSRC